MKELESQLVNIKSKENAVPKKRKHTPKQQNDDPMEIDGDTAADAWNLYEGWNPCPIGTLPNGKVPCLDMPALSK